MSRRTATLVAGAVLTLGIVALHREFHQYAGALWRDEVDSVNVATLPSLWRVISSAHLDSFPMAWVVVLYAWMRAGFGDSDAEIRRLGFAIGLATLPVLWWSARRLRVAAPLVALLLFGMDPTVIIYGSQVRGYGLGALAVAWVMGSLWAFVEQPSRGRGAVALAAAVLAAQTYFGNCFLLLGLCVAAGLVALRHGDTRRAGAVMLVGGTAAASMIANVPNVLYAARLSAIEKSSYSLGWLGNVFWGALGPGVPLLATMWSLAAVVAAIGCWLAWRARSAPGPVLDDADRAVYAAVSTMVGMAAYYAFLKYIGMQTNYWYYLPLMALLALAVETGIDLLVARVRAGELARIAAIAIGALLVARDVAASVRLRMTNVDVVAAAVARDARPTDFVVVAPWYMGLTFDRYYRGAAPWTTLPPMRDHRFHWHAELVERMKEGDAGIAPVFARIEQTLRAGRRVWIVGPLVATPEGRPPPRLRPWPDGPEGPLNGPYLDAWTLQLGDVLRRHGGDVQQVHFPTLGAVNRWESQPLEWVEGWRDE